MEDLLGSVRQVFDKLSALSTSACGGCKKDSHRNEAGLGQVFSLHPLSDADPEAVKATQRGVRLLHEGRIEESLRELHDAKQLAPSCHQVCSNLGCAYHANADDGQSLFWYREAHRLGPQSESNVLALSLLEQRRGQVDEAIRLLVTFLQSVDSAHVGALKQLGKLHQQEEHWSKAAGCFHRLIAIDPTNNEWPAQLQVCLDQLPVKDAYGEPVQSPNGMFARAFSFAEPILRHAVPTNQTEALSVTTRSRTDSVSLSSSVPAGSMPGRGSFQAQGRPNTARQPYQGHSNMGTSTAVAVQLQEAKRQRECGSPDAALGVYRGLLRLDSRNADALLGVADCQSDLGNIDAALEAGKQLIGVRPDDAEANLLVTELLFRAGMDADMAEPYLKRSLACDQRGNRSLQHRLLCATAEAALAREDHTKALAQASEAVRVDASAPRGLILLGTARLRIAEYQPALRALAAAVEACGPASVGDSRRLRAQACALTAQVHERMRQYPQALSQAQAAIDLEPQLWLARVVHAMALHQSGRSTDAEKELDGVLQRDPQNAMARMQLGYMQLCNNDPKAAKTLEGVLTHTRAARSSLGSAKVYLALALESLPDMGTYQRADRVVKEGLSLHRNLQHVWREIEGGLATQQGPLAAIQRLRGICDLDLNSAQARQLLGMLARAMGRADITRALSSVTPPKQRNNRAPSVPPSRWAAGGGPENVQPQTASSVSTSAGTLTGGPCPPSPLQRMRSASQTPGGMASQRPEMTYRGPSPGRTPMAYGQASGSASMRGRSREPSPMPQSGAPLELGWNEFIRADQLAFGPQLGAGGTAQVYRGSWNGQEVAIKKISGVSHLEDMKKEINALRRLRHPRLVRFIGACIQPPLLLVVTEFMSGGSLHDRLFGQRRDPPLAHQQRWAISIHMAEGLAFLHSNRVVHRDLKSMNILLDGSQSAKICDFGLAQQMEATHIVRKIDGEGGSPRYMAPECYDAAHGKITEKVDIWAMGCILIELFGCVLPYADCTTMATLTARILVEKRPPDVPRTVMEPLASLVRHCLTFEPPRRPSAAELFNELNRMCPR